MLARIFSPIQDHLDKAAEILTRVCNLRTVNLNLLVHLYCSPVDLTLRPALVILSAGMFGPVNPRIHRLATLFQLVFIAASLHKNISSAKEKGNGVQFPVLAGDYFYSKSFTILLEEGLEKYLTTLSDLIARVNEASILKLHRPGDPFAVENYVRCDTAGLLAWGCRISAEVSGAGEEEAASLYRYGFNLGMAIGLGREEVFPDKAAACFEQAKKELGLLPVGAPREIMIKVVDYFNRVKEDENG